MNSTQHEKLLEVAGIDPMQEVRAYMKLYGTASDEVRFRWFDAFTDPRKNKRGHVYSDKWIMEALRIMRLK